MPNSSEVAPTKQQIDISEPALPDVVAVKHVGDHDVFHGLVCRVDRLLHGRSGAGDDQRVPRTARDVPVALDELHLTYVDAVEGGFLEEYGRVLRVLPERLVVLEGKGRYRHDHPDLVALLRL